MARKPLSAVVIERLRPDRKRRPQRLFLGLLIAATLVASMSGCAIIKSVTPSQLNVVGKVRVTTTFCASDKDTANQTFVPADSSCQGSTHGGNQNADPTNNQTFQLTIGYRIPTTATAPSNFTSTNTSSPPTTPCGGGVTFSQSASLSAAMEARSPAGSGKQWVSYTSTVQTYTISGCQYTTVSPQFTLNQTGNQPFQGPFNYRVVVGFRNVDEATPGNTSARSFTCGTANITGLYTDGVDGPDNGTDGDMLGTCADDPSLTTINGADLSQATRDLGVIPTDTSVNAGGTATVPFNLKWSGAASGAVFNVSAGTTVPGTTATPSITTVTPPANSNNNMTVSVPVPAGTAPGTYDVTVTVTGTGSAAGQTRSGTAQLTVGALVFNPAPTLPSLGTITLNGQAQTKNAQMNNFGVNDTTTSPAGWNVTVAGNGSGSNSAVFAQYCNNGGSACGAHPANSYVSGGFTLPANSLTMNSTGASFSGGSGSAPTFQCAGGSCAIDSATPTKIASATTGNGTGLWSTGGFSPSSIALSTASTLRALPANEIYKLNAVWSLNSGP